MDSRRSPSSGRPSAGPVGGNDDEKWREALSMLRNYLAAALRNLVRNRLYAAINIIGLAVGFAAAILIALFVRDEFSYDKWIPGSERAYHVNNGTDPSHKLQWGSTSAILASLLRLEFPEIETVARISLDQVALR